MSDEECLPFMRDLCLQLLANVTRVQVKLFLLHTLHSRGLLFFAHGI